MASSSGIIRAIEAGVSIESVNGEGKSSTALIGIGHALIARGETLRVVNCGSLTGSSMIKIHNALAGKVTFEGA